MAKNAKTREEREAEEVAQAARERERLQQLVVDRQANRQREQEAKRLEDERKRTEQEAKKSRTRPMPVAIGSPEDMSQLSAALKGILPHDVQVKVSSTQARQP
jgi:hypothetical protein